MMSAAIKALNMVVLISLRKCRSECTRGGPLGSVIPAVQPTRPTTWCGCRSAEALASDPVLILAILGLGMGVGALAQLIVGREGPRVDWTMAFVAGFAGSLVGGLIFSLLAGDGLKIRLSGILGSLIGAI